MSALLAACAAVPAPEAVSATGDEVVFGYSGDQVVEAARAAALYCANLGRRAELRHVLPEGSERRLATFACRR